MAGYPEDSSGRIELAVAVAGARADRYIADVRPELSRTFVQRLFSQGRVRVDGCDVRPSFRLAAGARIEIELPPVVSPLAPEDAPLDIVFEDDDVIVVNKPAGLVVYPAAGHPDGTLLNAVISHCPGLRGMADTLRPGVVHRLDKDTSGLIVIAKNNAARECLVEQFQGRLVGKGYLVLVKGLVSPEMGIIDAPLGRHPSQRQRMAVVHAGREARTHYKVERFISGYSLLDISLETGRTHQIRVHLAAIGYPVVGDPVYGVRSVHLGRQFLHAYRLGFRLPSTMERREFTCPLPPDLSDALEAIERRPA